MNMKMDCQWLLLSHEWIQIDFRGDYKCFENSCTFFSAALQSVREKALLISVIYVDEISEFIISILNSFRSRKSSQTIFFLQQFLKNFLEYNNFTHINIMNKVFSTRKNHKDQDYLKYIILNILNISIFREITQKKLHFEFRS